MKFDTIPATEAHAIYVGERLRAAEVAELWALSRALPVAAAVESVRVSERAWCWLVDGQPAAIFGVAAQSIIGDTGMPWLLTTPVVDQHPMKFLRSCARGMREMRAAYPKLGAWVDARHTVCVKWLQWLGATVEPAQPFGALGLPFHRFEFKSEG